MTLTKFDLAALRKADAIVIATGGTFHGRAVAIHMGGRQTDANPFPQRSEYVLNVPITIYGYANQNAVCFAHEALYPDSATLTPAGSVLASLRVGDEVEFQFYPDAHTNLTLSRLDLHGDVLFLHVKRGQKRLVFTFSTSVCPENTARMCRAAEYALV